MANSKHHQKTGDTIAIYNAHCYAGDTDYRKFYFAGDSIEISSYETCLASTVTQGRDLDLYYYNDLRCVVNFSHLSLNKEIPFTKELFNEKLGKDWLADCILSGASIDGFNARDTSMQTSVFIAPPDSDNGVIVYLEIGYNSGIKILKIEEPEGL